jgi:hypothetical protein
MSIVRLLVLGACTALVASAACAAPAEPDAFAGSASPLKGAAYPVHVAPDPAAEARVLGALAELAPGAHVDFAPARGTLALVTGIELKVASCRALESVAPRLRAFVDAHPAAFAIDTKEWDTETAPRCDAISSSGEWVTWRRVSYGGLPVEHDVFALRVARTGRLVSITAVSGNYLPPATAATAAAMRAAPAFDRARGEAEVRATKLPYEIYEMCAPAGSGDYGAETSDAVDVTRETWLWDETATGADLRRVTYGALRVDPANYTPELLASDANCPREGAPHVGFAVTWDGVSSAVTYTHPGIDCVVCLAN